MTLKSLLCACALLTVAAAPVAADAAIITTTYAGVISDASMPNPGFDYLDTFGLFGPVGASLAGDAITVVYTTNDATPGVDYRANFILGFGAANPVSAVVTINGVSQTLSPPGAGDGFLGVGAAPNGITTYTDVASIPGLTEEAVFASVTDPDLTPGTDIHDALSDACMSTSCVGYGYLQFTQGTFPNDTFTETPIDIMSVSNSSSGIPTPVPLPSGTPEPATWTMLILGLGLTGFELRRRGALILA